MERSEDNLSNNLSTAQIEVRFRSDSHESRLDAWCVGGQIQSTTEETSS